MLRSLQTAVIVLGGIVLAIVLYTVVNAEFSMDFQTGMSPGFAWLLQMRAAENGGQIAPSFDELGLASDSGSSGMPFPGATESAGPSLLDGMDLTAAPAQLGRDLARLSAGVVVAIVLEIVFVFVTKRFKRRPSAA